MKNPRLRVWQVLAGLVMLFLITVLIVSWTSVEEFTVDYSFDGRKRLRLHIVSNIASSKADRAATAQAAARFHLNEKQAQQVTVHLEVGKFSIGKGESLAIAIYTPDGCGDSGNDCNGKAWKIFASDRQLSILEEAMMKEWYANRDSFRKNDGILNEDKLKNFIAQKLEIPLGLVTPPHLDMQELTKQD